MVVKSISDHRRWQRSSKGNIRKLLVVWDFLTGPIAFDEANIKSLISVYTQRNSKKFRRLFNDKESTAKVLCHRMTVSWILTNE
jgi:hypothetical protein